ncbi:ABC transporter D family member 2, chloroplastic [Dendrobium catenatum]|uniref:ABC transporter D family member 2, chloroplastic n=1 Tax=Dendrobium catenatum TaxID=906689 RepID=A0A2I0WAK1_9ASPA|nr:ABC transporter D family member 2, chloroplastic [Dendrobium catenatum]
MGFTIISHSLLFHHYYQSTCIKSQSHNSFYNQSCRPRVYSLSSPLLMLHRRRSASRGSTIRLAVTEDAGAREGEQDKLLIVSQIVLQDDQRAVPNLETLLRRFWKVASPYWSSEDKIQARLKLAAVFALTLGTTGISVGFNFLGRDFYNALASM